MKILICGKGGSGKSTVSVLLARAFNGLGYRVLLVDADESNFGVPHLLGVDAPENLMDSLGGKKGFKQQLNQGLAPDAAFGGKRRMDGIPEKCRVDAGGILMTAVGKIHNFGEGCACPMGVLSKRFLSSLETGENEIVIVDAEAGVEHFGRGVDGQCDLLIGVVDPTAESFLLAEKIIEMGAAAHRDVFFILNKAEPEIEAIMRSRIDPARLLGVIPKSNSLFLASLEGRPLEYPDTGMDEIAKEIIARFAGRSVETLL
ncbi:MAG: P-loop NTPase [Deltaproteobacteria bacterium]|nr:P-loop NTPase [Deltaproteobacteria bacterium]